MDNNQTPPLSESRPEELEQQIAETQHALSEKIETLKSEVKSTFENAEDSVRETIDDVKRAFDLRHQIRQNPWMFVAGAVATGLVVGKVIGPRKKAKKVDSNIRNTESLNHFDGRNGIGSPRASHLNSNGHGSASFSDYEPSKPGIISRVADRFGDELNTLKGVAIGALFGTIREFAQKTVPESFSDRVGDLFSETSEKLGLKIPSAYSRKDSKSSPVQDAN